MPSPVPLAGVLLAALLSLQLQSDAVVGAIEVGGGHRSPPGGGGTVPKWKWNEYPYFHGNLPCSTKTSDTIHFLHITAPSDKDLMGQDVWSLTGELPFVLHDTKVDKWTIDSRGQGNHPGFVVNLVYNDVYDRAQVFPMIAPGDGPFKCWFAARPGHSVSKVSIASF